ncbi:hypothetical protein Salat_0501200 [Sesamum alatum]|uniref:DUF6737 domain-containing protein n=1 Tax=Sesamum alatum TaxID=300844 RepID=A0AAE2D0U0_9LAMI|nr:hypothetical protein Salat_0501200 [Sesamum alatum]
MIAVQCHPRFPISLNLSSSSQRIKPQISPIFSSRNLSSVSRNVRRNRNQTTLVRSDSRDGVEPVKESAFFDENGAVEDMDGYLNYLSLEYDSVWDTKPSWCQPWTVTLTGIGIITGSWLVSDSVRVTSVVTAVICLWWCYFLYFYPKAYSDKIAKRRKKVASGVEDTYGMKTGQ